MWTFQINSLKKNETYQSFRYKTSLLLAKYPQLYISYTQWRDTVVRRGTTVGGHLLNWNTDILIDGFPRSANTFAVVAFKLSQLPSGVKMANHRHDPSQVIAAIYAKVPTLVLLRKPEEACISFIIRNCKTKNYSVSILANFLRKYIQYYQPLLPLKDNIVIAKFETVTTNFALPILKINQIWNRNFGIFNHTKENVHKCYEEIEKYTKMYLASADDFEAVVSKPSHDRDQDKQILNRLMASSEIQDLRDRANQIYEYLLNSGNVV